MTDEVTRQSGDCQERERGYFFSWQELLHHKLRIMLDHKYVELYSFWFILLCWPEALLRMEEDSGKEQDELRTVPVYGH